MPRRVPPRKGITIRFFKQEKMTCRGLNYWGRLSLTRAVIYGGTHLRPGLDDILWLARALLSCGLARRDGLGLQISGRPLKELTGVTINDLC